MLDSAPNGVGTDQRLVRRTERVSMAVIEQRGSKLSVPISGLGT
jgi:hypothetical protein